MLPVNLIWNGPKADKETKTYKKLHGCCCRVSDQCVMLQWWLFKSKSDDIFTIKDKQRRLSSVEKSFPLRQLLFLSSLCTTCMHSQMFLGNWCHCVTMSFSPFLKLPQDTSWALLQACIAFCSHTPTFHF